ncbi:MULTISPECIES: hypothetical protein [unclassified Flavobacterium]|uniref:hypothetical protein n=1 Tax=unclassified Flavobacterium TaxID=196869 RepID=UPI001F12D41B|nr:MULTISPECIES: hypothetical protein [unclassified Flavobacterium]UMY65436.1 hypothetical protein MKO97_13125 [Flavobacterium sp. HJ-32-4]
MMAEGGGANLELDESLLVNQANNAPGTGAYTQEYKFYASDYEKLLLANFDQNMQERKHYAECIYVFTSVWCICILFIVICVGTGYFVLSDLVVTTIIGSTTINVFIFFRLVTQYLFNANHST